MKKFLFAICLILCVFLSPFEVEAKKKSLGACNYNINVDKLGLGNLKKLNLSVTVYDDGSTDKRKISGKDYNNQKFSYAPKSGLLLGDSGIYLQYEKMFNKNGNYYKKYKDRNNCPNLQFIYFVSTNQLHFNVDGNRDALYNPSFVATAKSTGGEGKKPSKVKTYCDKRFKEVRNWNKDIYITTKETNGIREVEFYDSKESDAPIGTGKYNEIVTIEGFYFRFDEKDYDLYWSDKCMNAPLFLWAPNADGQRIIQSNRPHDAENGSYAANEATEDFGYDILGQKERKNNASSSNWNQKIECEDIFDFETPGAFGWLLQKIFNYIKVIGPILVVLLSSVDFIKAVVGFDEKAMKEAQNKLIIRLVAALALFLIPTLLQALMNLINLAGQSACNLK